MTIKERHKRESAVGCLLSAIVIGALGLAVSGAFAMTEHVVAAYVVLGLVCFSWFAWVIYIMALLTIYLQRETE